MNTNKTPLSKGYLMEELLRNYFLKTGYYVVRGVPFVYEGFDITDIDLWLYGRNSSVSREITIVDAKNKRTPQAIERIFWTQGLKIATNATNAIVATTDKRVEVKTFGKQLNTLVLDGIFLKKLANSENSLANRLSDEEFIAKIKDYSLNKLDGDWIGRIYFSKSILIKSLNFDGCIEWLGQGKFFIEQSIIKGLHQETALRCLYLVCSFLTIALDYCMKELSFFEQNERIEFIKNGFTYGTRGSTGFSKVLNVAMGLVEEHVSNGHNISQKVRRSVETQLSSINSSILAEFFSKTEVAKSLFNVSKEFENLAMTRNFTHHNSSSVELKSLLFCLLDYWNIDRVLFSKASVL